MRRAPLLASFPLQGGGSAPSPVLAPLLEAASEAVSAAAAAAVEGPGPALRFTFSPAGVDHTAALLVGSDVPLAASVRKSVVQRLKAHAAVKGRCTLHSSALSIDVSFSGSTQIVLEIVLLNAEHGPIPFVPAPHSVGSGLPGHAACAMLRYWQMSGLGKRSKVAGVYPDGIVATVAAARLPDASPTGLGLFVDCLQNVADPEAPPRALHSWRLGRLVAKQLMHLALPLLHVFSVSRVYLPGGFRTR